ncbi:MAG: CDP-alcohol phosphatidyltransferase family protein [Anaerolineae bacterium]|nr:CDP-alcohol phosphatidyltransferase family protein [Anaerolineae bacterium]
MRDSYSSFERRFLDHGRGLLLTLLKPATLLLAALHVSPDVISVAQIGVGVIIVFTVTPYPRLAFLLFLLTLLLDALDGTLARHTGRASPFGALLDQFCDHVREVLVIAALARAGALSPFPAVLYAIAYPALNLTLFLCNVYRVPLPVALKSYLVVYPALFAYLWFGVNWLDGAVSLSVGLMALVVVQGLFYLQRGMRTWSL